MYAGARACHSRRGIVPGTEIGGGAVRLSCVTCADEPDPGQVAWATVHSSEREFEHERFAVWRCPRCRCIHAFGDVDLDRYYRRYGLHETGLDLLERVFYRNKLRFIRRFVPLDRGGPVLDFGCGNGIFVEYLRRRGYTDVAGYDPYSAAHADPRVLGRRYRLVLSTDVVEHVPSPAEHLARAGEQVAPGGFLYLQTPTPTISTWSGRQRSARCSSSPTTGTWSRRPGSSPSSTSSASNPWPGPTAPTSTPGSRSSTCRRSTGTWTGTAGWSPSNEPFRWSSLLQPGFWYRGLAGGLVSRTDEVQLIFRRAG